MPILQGPAKMVSINGRYQWKRRHTAFTKEFDATKSPIATIKLYLERLAYIL